MPTHRISVGNTLTPIGMILRQNGRGVDLTGATVKFAMFTATGAVKVAETASNVTLQPTSTFTADAATDKLTSALHRLQLDDEVFVSNSGGALPGGLAAATRYWVVGINGDTFQLATSKRGSAIDVTSAGTGTHSFEIIGSMQYDFQAADVNSPGTFHAYATLYSGAEWDTFPVVSQQLSVDIFPVN